MDTSKHNHNHIWRDTIMPIPKKTKAELLATIRKCAGKGFWLKDEEIIFAKELESEGYVKLCCAGEAATVIEEAENRNSHTGKKIS